MVSTGIISAATNNRHKSADTLTFGAYAHVLKEEKHFQLLDWPLDHLEFVRQIREVADIRNKMMHFSPDPVPTDEWGAIDGMLAMQHPSALTVSARQVVGQSRSAASLVSAHASSRRGAVNVLKR